MMTVSEVSRLTGVSIRTLQYYDKIGLLHPSGHTEAGYRLYDDTALARLQTILLFRELELTGGVLRVNGKIVAFTLGEALCEDTFVVHIEKAYADVDGAYTMINQQFVQRNCTDVMYVNREEDLGLEGLRKAKKSYYPVMRGVKYMAVPKE